MLQFTVTKVEKDDEQWPSESNNSQPKQVDQFTLQVRGRHAKPYQRRNRLYTSESDVCSVERITTFLTVVDP